jgi:hypothetical protein
MTDHRAESGVAPARDELAPAHDDAAGSEVIELERLAADAVNRLAEHADPAAFQALLRLSAQVGECLGVNARTIAANGSWAKVAEVAGTSRQAAWSRWSS